VLSHFGLAIYIKGYLKAKEESWKFKYFTMQKYFRWMATEHAPEGQAHVKV
jgi:hypothetical protein